MQWSNMAASGAADESSNLSRATTFRMPVPKFVCRVSYVSCFSPSGEGNVPRDMINIV